MLIHVLKKDGSFEEFNPNKIKSAITLTADRCDEILSEQDKEDVVSLVLNRIDAHGFTEIPVKRLHNFVELALDRVNPVIAKNYRDYRNYKNTYGEAFQRTVDYSLNLHTGQDKENANAPSELAAVKRAKRCGFLTKEIYTLTEMRADVRKAHDDGYIYLHDLSARMDGINCCLFDVERVLTNGFDMENVHYTEPKTLDVAFDVIGDIVLSAASQQYGGFTIPEIDKILERYAEKSYQKLVQKSLSIMGVASIDELSETEKTRILQLALDDVQRIFEQGFQGWEYKFNTVGSSRGDYPFITITMGLNTSLFGRMANKALLKVRMEGQMAPGKSGIKIPVPFPKIVFLYDKNIHCKDGVCEDVFEMAVACSMKSMYPDWLSLTGQGYVPDIYKRYKKVVSPMGCRAFLSPWYEKGGMYPLDEADEPIFVGRFNIGVVSLNLPMIYQKSLMTGSAFMGEGGELDYYLEMIRQIHLRTYSYLGKMKASHNPLAFCQGGFLGGTLQPNDCIEPILKSATASFGITALNELQMLYNGKGLHEDNTFALEVMRYINKKVDAFKKADGRLYAIYGTPAESLCGRQAEQFRTKYGIIKGVSDKPYVSNSFHCHVASDITPIEKQDAEYPFWSYLNGGKIQYVRYPIDYNENAVKALITRAMDMGYYEGVNMSLAYCNHCGYQQLEMDCCPVCGSNDLTKIDRMNGYLAYSRIHGDTRLGAAKMAEIADRKSM